MTKHTGEVCVRNSMYPARINLYMRCSTNPRTLGQQFQVLFLFTAADAVTVGDVCRCTWTHHFGKIPKLKTRTVRIGKPGPGIFKRIRSTLPGHINLENITTLQ